ncbi:MAG TPA: AAA family ATPase [Candidatus Paceibacterota bacterium]
MKLKYADIVNFRSIQSIKVDFEPFCRVLVGINESGKSNILRALSTVGEEYTPTPEDIREPLPTEKSVTEAYVRFVFTLDKNEVEQIYAAIKPKILSKKADVPLITKGDKNLSLHDFCTTRNEGIYSVDIQDAKKSAKYWTIDNDYSVLSNWKKPSPSCPADYNVQVGSTALPLKNYALINTDEHTEIPEAHLEDIDADYVNGLVGSEITKLVPKSLPKVIFWKYDEQNLLPPTINLDTFADNPDSVVPLKNMFMLAGITDIADDISKARAVTGGNKLRNLLNRVADHSTKHFRSVWKEYKEISFALEPNATNIDANIKEKNHWKMSQRSDGVKRFITFLLHISANVKANLLNDALLLIDEPDMGLHPSGSRYLRDELIETAKKNYVIFSTHSIFMIDKDNINRHIIVKKEHEKTSITNATKSNFVDEEVLFNALNYTVFDILKQDNIIFEGWRDKKLFQTALKKIPDTHTQDLMTLKERLKTVGLCHAEGVKDIRNITPLLELANRNCIIVSDGDTPAKEKQKEFHTIHGYGVWKRYDEISKNLKAETGEDFIKEDVFKLHLEGVKEKNPSITGDPTLENTGKVTAVKKWLLNQNVASELVPLFLNELKHNIFDDLKTSDVDASYYDFLKDFSSLIDTAIPETK